MVVNPSDIWFLVQEGNLAECGTGGVSMVGTSILPDGFILYGDIKTDMAIVTCGIEY